MDTLTVSPETHAKSFSKCQPGEVVSITGTGTYGAPNPDGSYPLELTTLTKTGTKEPAEEAVEESESAVSPAAAAILKAK